MDPSSWPMWQQILAGSLILCFLMLLSSWVTWRVTIGSKKASHDRTWVPDNERMPHFEFHEDGDTFTLRNRRDFTWRKTRDFDVRWDDWTAKVSELERVYYVVDHFHSIRGLAHTMMCFRFSDDRFLACSFEVRREEGERYHPWTALWREYELYFVWGTERDMLGLRTNARDHDVYLFPTDTLPEKREAILRRLMERANELHGKPEWYNTLTKTCATSIMKEVNTVTPGRIPPTWRALLPGYSAKIAWKRGILTDKGGFSKTVTAAAISKKGKEAGIGEPDSNEYSLSIRA